MKIFFLARSLDFGGAERQLVSLAKGVAEKGHHVTVGVFYKGGALEKELLGNKVNLVNLNKKSRWDIVSFLFTLLTSLRKNKPDIAYGFLGVPNILLILLKPFIRAKIIWGVRASDMDLAQYDWLARKSYQLECLLSQFSDLVISNSTAGKNYAIKNGFPGKKIIVIENGIDTSRFRMNPSNRDEVRAELQLGQDKIIGFVGRIDPMKDIPSLLNGFAIIAKKRSDLKLVLVGDGDGEHKKKILEQISELNIKEKVLLTGPRKDVDRILNAFDVFVSSSITEGFSNVIAEAMAAGVPCVVTDVGDSKTIVSNSGEVIPPRNPERLAFAIDKILNERKSSEEIRYSIVSRFSESVMINKTLEAIGRIE